MIKVITFKMQVRALSCAHIKCQHKDIINSNSFFQILSCLLKLLKTHEGLGNF